MFIFYLALLMIHPYFFEKLKVNSNPALLCSGVSAVFFSAFPCGSLKCLYFAMMQDWYQSIFFPFLLYLNLN